MRRHFVVPDWLKRAREREKAERDMLREIEKNIVLQRMDLQMRRIRWEQLPE